MIELQFYNKYSECWAVWYSFMSFEEAFDYLNKNITNITEIDEINLEGLGNSKSVYNFKFFNNETQEYMIARSPWRIGLKELIK